MHIWFSVSSCNCVRGILVSNDRFLIFLFSSSSEIASIHVWNEKNPWKHRQISTCWSIYLETKYWKSGHLDQFCASVLALEQKKALLKNYWILLAVSGSKIMMCLCVKILNCNNMQSEWLSEWGIQFTAWTIYKASEWQNTNGVIKHQGNLQPVSGFLIYILSMERSQSIFS